MRRQPRLAAFCLPFAFVMLLGIGLQPLASHAQDDADAEATENPTRLRRVRPGEEGLIIFGLVDQLRSGPTFVRLSRQVMEPGVNSDVAETLHLHPGPEVGVVESGISTVLVGSESDLLPAGRTKPIPALVGEEIELERGDQALYRDSSAHSFGNTQDEGTLTVLTASLQACGESCENQTIPGFVYADDFPTGAGYSGLLVGHLGLGVATQPPTGQTAIAVERLILDPGESVPSSDLPTMLSLEDGQFDFTTVDGQVQLQRTEDLGAGVPTVLESDEDVSLVPQDSVFFPVGHAEVERPESSGLLSLLRMTIYEIPTGDSAATPAASPVAGEESVRAVIEISDAPEPTEAAEPADDGVLGVGDVVVVNEVEVRLRDAPTVNSNIVIGLDQGAEFTITDGPVEADNFVWYAVESTVDPTIVGWIAGQFISPA